MYGRGHEQGTRKQHKPANPWWADEEEARIQAVEAAWQDTQQPTQGQGDGNGNDNDPA